MIRDVLPLDLSEYGFTGEAVSPGDEHTADAECEGVSVSLTERAMALRALGVIYARRAHADGLRRAAKLSGPRNNLRLRYADVDSVVSCTLARAKRNGSDEARYLEILAQNGKLIAAGFDPTDVASEGQIVAISVRRAIGAAVGAAARNRVLSGVYAPETETCDNNIF